MPRDRDGFDFEWDLNSENGMNFVENKLYDALIRSGLEPQQQYKVSLMAVDFAFPKIRLVIEINGPHHQIDKFKKQDGRRYYKLKKFHWKKITVLAEEVYEDPDKVANYIKQKYLFLKSTLIQKSMLDF